MEAPPEQPPFDTTRAGTSEQAWDDWTRLLPTWTPPRGPLLVIAPHPDDETLGAGGLIHSCLSQGATVTVLSISDGEAACPEVPGLADLRQAELAGSLRTLGAESPDIIRLRLPDGQLQAHEDEIRQAISALLQQGMFLVAPFEFDGHADHDAAGRAAWRVARDRSVHLIRYPIWAWHRGSRVLRSARKAVRFMLTAQSWSAKQRAIELFHSQLMERPGGAIVPPNVRACFTRAYEVFLL